MIFQRSSIFSLFFLLLQLLFNVGAGGLLHAQSPRNIAVVMKPSCQDNQYTGADSSNCSNLNLCSTLLPGNDALMQIGSKCMIRTPHSCKGGEVAGVSCLNLNQIFTTDNSKYLRPISCPSDGSGHGDRCLKANLSFCHKTSNPLLGINCRLASCNEIPNELVRQPGINCLADCNKVAGSEIYQNQFFFEGLNCLPSCRTTANPNPGQNCVLEFNNYVMPFCTDANAALPRLMLNWSGDQIFRRKNCLDVNDLPLCSSFSATNQRGTALVDCVNECQAGNNAASPNSNCIAFTGANGFDPNKTIAPMCHHYLSLSNQVYDQRCKKYTCDILSSSELASSRSRINEIEKYCTINDSSHNPISCSNFSIDQLKYTYFNSHCLPIECKCSDSDLGPDQTRIKELDIFYKNNAYTNAYTESCKSFAQNTQNSNPNINTSPCCIQNKKYCLVPSNITQTYSCIVSQQNGQDVLVLNPTCDSTSDCSKGFCEKTNINCREGNNSDLYSACKSEDEANSNTDEDPYVSWFFRPTPHKKALKDDSGSKVLRQMSGYPISGNIKNGKKKDDIFYTIDDMKANGYGSTDVFNGFWHSYVGGDDTRSPGAQKGPGMPNAISWYNRVCGMTGKPQATPDEDFGYYKGEVVSFYSDNDEAHQITLCLRNPNSGITTGIGGDKSTCGKRECGISASPGPGFTGNICGYDICKTVIVGGGDKYNRCSAENDDLFEHFDVMGWITEEASSFVLNGGAIGMLLGQTQNSPDSSVVDGLSLAASGGAAGISDDQLYGMMGKSLDGNDPVTCLAKFGSDLHEDANNLRVRAYKPFKNDNYICAALDVLNISGSNHFDGTEKFELEDGKYACVSGTLDSNGACVGGRDTSGGDTTVWHTVGIFKYIGDVAEYLFKRDDGSVFKKNNPGIFAPYAFNKYQTFKKSDCIRHPLRIGAPMYENLVTLGSSRSLRMITPPLQIIRTCKKKAQTCEILDSESSPTDFYEPMIEVGYGYNAALEPIPSKNHLLLSIDFNSKTNQAPVGKSYETLEVSFDGIGYVSEVYFQKENGAQPRACLYRKVKDETAPSGYATPDELIGCVYRNMPTFNNSDQISEPLRKFLISTNSSSFDDFSLSFSYLYLDTGSISSQSQPNISQRKSAKCGDQIAGKEVLCSTSTKVSLADEIFSSFAFPGNENFSYKVEREECSKLNYECVKRKTDLNQKLKNGDITWQDVDSDYIMSGCMVLLSNCNQKKGINLAVFNPSKVSGFNQSASLNNYGWFNEICITSGFSEVLSQKVLAKLPSGVDGSIIPGVLGKCEINSVKKNSSVDCSEGGREPDCPCLKESDLGGEQLDSYHIFRSITPREAGLCVDITTAKTCPAISYPFNINDIQNKFFTSASDLDLVSNEILSGSTNQSVATISHQSRSKNSFTDIEIPTIKYDNGHVEFDMAIAGESAIIGSCNGFWKNQVFVGDIINPVADCGNDGVWKNFRNPCERFSCPAINTSVFGSDSSGLYPGYDTSSPLGFIGAGHGYANWPIYKKTNDVIESVSASSCLVGYRANGSKALVGADFGSETLLGTYQNTTLSSDGKELLASIRSQNNGYQGGVMPIRQCDQLGFWRFPTSQCSRIICPKTSNLPQIPSGNSQCGIQNSISSSSNNFCLSDILTMWSKIGGVVVNSDGLASRTNLSGFYLDDSLVQGSCAQNLGFYQSSSNNQPKLFCDSLGNWSSVVNRCQRDCAEVSGNAANDSGEGFAYWLQSKLVVDEVTYAPSTAKSCITGRYPNPYPPRKDKSGENGINDYNAVLTSVSHSKNTNGTSVYLASRAISANKLKIIIPSNGSNVSSDVKFSDGSYGNELPVKRFTAIGSSIGVRDPFVGEIEAGKTYIFQKESTNNYWVAALAFNQDVNSDERTQNYLPSLPSRMCSFKQNVTGLGSAWTAPDSFCVNGCLGWNEDDRTGVGITIHQTSSGVVKVKWDSQSFESWQVKEFSGLIDQNGFAVPEPDASQPLKIAQFTTEARNSGSKKFVLARKCNSQTHKWEDPISLCPAGSTQNPQSGVVYASDNAALVNREAAIGNYLKLNSLKDATCNSGYSTNFTKDASGNVSFSKLSYSCSFKDNAKNLDEILVSKQGTPCIRTCSSSRGRGFGPTSYDPSNYNQNIVGSNLFKEGEKLNLECNSSYAHMTTTNSRRIEAGENLSKLCAVEGVTTTNRLKDGPYVECYPQGEAIGSDGWSSVRNACEQCKGCIFYGYKNSYVQSSDSDNQNNPNIFYPGYYFFAYKGGHGSGGNQENGSSDRCLSGQSILNTGSDGVPNARGTNYASSISSGCSFFQAVDEDGYSTLIDSDKRPAVGYYTGSVNYEGCTSEKCKVISNDANDFYSLAGAQHSGINVAISLRHGQVGGPVCRYTHHGGNGGKKYYNGANLSYTCFDGKIDLKWTRNLRKDDSKKGGACDGDDWDNSNQSESKHSPSEYFNPSDRDEYKF